MLYFFGNVAILFLTAASRFERRLTNGPEAAQKVETTAHILIKMLFPQSDAHIFYVMVASFRILLFFFVRVTHTSTSRTLI